MKCNSSHRLIGLMVDSTPQLPVGLLGILKSGNGFVPIDPRYPEERVNFIIADCELEIVITQAKYVELLAETENPGLAREIESLAREYTAAGRPADSAGTNAANTTIARPNNTSHLRVRTLRMVFRCRL